jgi:hypothetical protein
LPQLEQWLLESRKLVLQEPLVWQEPLVQLELAQKQLQHLMYFVAEHPNQLEQKNSAP